jgi:hypothetical protein
LRAAILLFTYVERVQAASNPGLSVRDGGVLLSKSKFIAGLPRPKLLWQADNSPGQFPATDAQTRAIFDQGHEIGALAKTLFPEIDARSLFTQVDVTADETNSEYSNI